MSPELQATARKGTQLVFWIAILVLSVLMGMVVQSQWLTFLQFWNRVPTDFVDPIFNQDISFYIFSLPVLSFLVHLGLVLVALSVLAAAITYVTLGHLAYLQRLQLSHEARVHLTLLAVAGFLLLAGRFWLNCYEILYSREGVIFGAGYTDVHARLSLHHDPGRRLRPDCGRLRRLHLRERTFEQPSIRESSSGPRTWP